MVTKGYTVAKGVVDFIVIPSERDGWRRESIIHQMCKLFLRLFLEHEREREKRARGWG